MNLLEFELNGSCFKTPAFFISLPKLKNLLYYET